MLPEFPEIPRVPRVRFPPPVAQAKKNRPLDGFLGILAEAAGISNLHHLFRNSLILQAGYPGLAQKKHPTWGASLARFYTLALSSGAGFS